MIFHILAADLNALAGNSRSAALKILFLSHAFHMVACYRIGCSLAKIPLVGKFLRTFTEYFIRILFASDISLKSKIGPGLVILHGHDIVIGANTIIGSNCKIFNGVTLGNKNTEIDINYQPIIGDNVILSTGCKILGGINIGSNVIVGANSVVLKDIPSNSIAVGVPAVVKKKKIHESFH